MRLPGVLAHSLINTGYEGSEVPDGPPGWPPITGSASDSAMSRWDGSGEASGRITRGPKCSFVHVGGRLRRLLGCRLLGRKLLERQIQDAVWCGSISCPEYLFWQ
ncbi:hypothetical protein E2C01_031445 [Portunus trituberculatus]|uniref:Uncharacterized protein n=1 Tax=Portunus trituberculatus TaxID=210409 RepID=A0A5B7EXP3_PORTR|nr:hypothetical protein [Portunus trituberculatus]